VSCYPLNSYEFAGCIEIDLEDTINTVLSKKLLDGAGGKSDFLVVGSNYLYILHLPPIVGKV